MSIILIGYRGSGKTTLGRRLADRLGLQFHDCDERIVHKAGRNIREIFERSGEDAFRDIEQAVVAELVRLPHSVIALGGGTLGREANRAILLAGVEHRIVYVRAEPHELLRRVQLDPRSQLHRPNLTSLGGGIDEIRIMLARREPIYLEMMTDLLDVTALTPDQALATLENLLQAEPAGRRLKLSTSAPHEPSP